MLAYLGRTDDDTFFCDRCLLPLPEGEFEDVLTGARHRGGARPLSELLAQFPVALLVMRN